MAAIAEGKKAPSFALADGAGNRVSLGDFKGKNVVVYFYPKDDTPGCTKEACGFRDLWKDLQRAGVVVLGDSADGAFSLEQAVRMLTLVPSTLWGFADRGLVREGFAADLVVFDPDTIAPEMPEVVNDLPAGARRLVQRARGFAATVVNGAVLLRDGKHTGALPGAAPAWAARTTSVGGGRRAGAESGTI